MAIMANWRLAVVLFQLFLKIGLNWSIPSDNSLFFSRYSNSTENERKQASGVILISKHDNWIRKALETFRTFFSFATSWNNNCWTNHNQGTCMLRKTCLTHGGNFGEICAGGFGVCCIHEYYCGSVTPFNRTYFTNPHFPNSWQDEVVCEHKIINVEGICQLRLDFEVFELEPPVEGGYCRSTWFQVEGVEKPLPPLCGDLSGHHVYLETTFDPEVRLTFNTVPGHFSGRWKVRVTKFKCGSSSVAPGGCAQYHYGIMGRVTSFNYLQSNIASLDYGVCVRKEKGFCAIQWSLCDNNDNGEWLRRKRSLIQESGRVVPDIMVGQDTKSATRRPLLPAYFESKEDAQKQFELQATNFTENTLIRTGLGFVRYKSGTTKLGHKVIGGLSKPPRFYQQLKTKGQQPSLPIFKAFVPKQIIPASKRLTPKRHQFGIKNGARPKPNLKHVGGTWIKPHTKLKPGYKIPLKGHGKWKVKPKPIHKHKAKGSSKGCKPIVVPFPIPLPLPIPIPITPVVVVPFPFGGAGGAHGNKGWMEDGKIYSATEPFLLRVHTAKKNEGEDSFCMDWEQISCYDWQH